MGAKREVVALNAKTYEVERTFESINEAAREMIVGKWYICKAAENGSLCRGYYWLLAERGKLRRRAYVPENVAPADGRVSREKAIEIMRNNQGKAYAAIMAMTGWSLEDLRNLYDEHKLYRRSGGADR